MPPAEKRLLAVEGLKTSFFTEEGEVRAVDDVSFSLRKGDTLGLVGESGCGKSVTALSIIGLLDKPVGRIVDGRILFDGRGDLTRFSEGEMRKIRGNEISMIFQEPMTSLNPVIRIGKQISETIRLHQRVSEKDAVGRAVEMLRMVNIPSPEKRIDDYPHRLSGGMRQRVMIAMALSCNPKLMLADEPTTALDVTIQAQILNLMNRLKQVVGTSILLITHDLGVIAKMAQNVCVMYAGVVVEHADVLTLFSTPLHPYTRGLLTSIPRGGGKREKMKRLNTIEGIVPNLIDLPTGCRFSDRCTEVMPRCREQDPVLIEVSGSKGEPRQVRCRLYDASA